MKRVATAFAPASVANVAVGFDLLGFSVDFAGDQVTVETIDEPSVELAEISGKATGLPTDPLTNCATAGLVALREELGLAHGFRVRVEKGIALGSGMGGSAASAVASVVAANALLEHPLPLERLARFALIGEFAASGGYHADNVGPSLFGGLTLATLEDPVSARAPTHGVPEVRITSIPIPAGIHCVLLHPHLEIETRSARKLLRPELPMRLWIQQSARLAGFISGCHSGDLALIRESFQDLVIEPQRAHLIPAFGSVQSAALGAGALGCSISGSGPSVFAWAADAADAWRIEAAMRKEFAKASIATDAWNGALPARGARVIS